MLIPSDTTKVKQVKSLATFMFLQGEAPLGSCSADRSLSDVPVEELDLTSYDEETNLRN
ncbi:hypothetical protein SCLCIDRAFT_1219992 [Scleroderma citrinum Foug A]|uniref:Uncharacterized protein n=1 Tax=Scleroderma citrinum Foug A TaxID=1036808 RepID=A0A0C3DK96_9AGAM|nr:hypothetical protein SCLCIDRAFT_1219992 [Scleroderma citrinum Foug A]